MGPPLGTARLKPGAGSKAPYWGRPGFRCASTSLLGVRWRGRLLGAGRAVAGLRTPWTGVSTTMLL